MAVNITRGKVDVLVEQIVAALDGYARDHPAAQIDVYRINPVSVRARVIDPTFAGTGRPERHDTVWRYLESAPDAAQAEISSLVLIAPGEQGRSAANTAFENPDDEDFDFALP